jgi:hypothetical protein
MELPPDWDSLLADHSNAVAEYMTAAGRFASPDWMRPLAPGKWTPAELTSHVTEAYRVLRAELGGATGMRLLGSRLQRLVLRYTLLPRLLAGRPFPAGVRAPRETRPREIVEEPGDALSMLGDLAEAFIRELTTRAAGARIRLTHAYFGPLSPRQGLRLLTVHTRHHARQLSSARLAGTTGAAGLGSQVT